MSVSFYAVRAPEDPRNLAGWELGTLQLNHSATTVGQILTLLGIPVDYSAECSGSIAVAELRQRVAVAKIEGLTVAQERWGHLHRPGFFSGALELLAGIADEAERMGGEVAWA